MAREDPAEHGAASPQAGPVTEGIDVDALREEFADAMRREYLADYPERRTEGDEP